MTTQLQLIITLIIIIIINGGFVSITVSLRIFVSCNLLFARFFKIEKWIIVSLICACVCACVRACVFCNGVRVEIYKQKKKSETDQFVQKETAIKTYKTAVAG